MKYRNPGNMGFDLLDSALEKSHFSASLGTADTLSYRKCICHGTLLIWRSLKVWLSECLSFNQIGRVGRGAFLVVLLYFFFWPQVTHRITMVQVNISMEGRKRGQQNCFCISKGLCLRQVFILLLIWSVSAVDVHYQVGGRYLLWQDCFLVSIEI